MAYRYNEKTGEFEEAPQSTKTSKDNDSFDSVLSVIGNILPYAIGILLAATCS